MKIALAYLTFVAFVPFALLVMRRMALAEGAAISVLVGSIMLPEFIAIDLPVVPPIDKEYLTYLTTLVGAVLFHRRAVLSARPGTGGELIVLALFVANVATAMKNGQPMFDEGKLEDALGPYWIAATTVDDVLTIAVPYFVGRALFRSIDDAYVFMRTLVVAATGYTLLITFESVMNVPFRVWQFSEVLYGLPARVNMRWGLAQPVVFFDNGLALATFMACATIAASAIAKADLPLPHPLKAFGVPRLPASLARNIVLVGLILARNVAGAVYGVTFFTAYLFAHARLVTMLGVGLAVLACVYPSLRMADVFPYETIVDFAREYDAERARSLEGRFHEEEHVLGQIGDRLWLGWGTYSRIPGAETFGRGEVGLDGWVTIRIGVAGVVGVALYYFVFASAVFRGWMRIGRAPRKGQVLIGALMCMISIRMIDMIINGWWNCLPVFLSGVLAGVAGNAGRKPARSAKASARASTSSRRRPEQGPSRAERREPEPVARGRSGVDAQGEGGETSQRSVSTAELLGVRRPEPDDDGPRRDPRPGKGRR